jgi:hypothetical protein
MNDDLSDRKLFQTEIKTLQKNLNKDNLIIPYYQSDKWMNLLKKKVGTMAQEYNEYLRLNMEQYNPMKKKIKDLDKENQLKEAELINVDTLENPFFNRTNGFGIRDVNRLQQTSLYKMFPKFRNRTSHSFYSAKHRNSKVKKISFFGNNYVEDITEQGIQTFSNRNNRNIKDLEKKKYMDYIKRKSEDDYMKYYYNCYG